jgi:hypothetical protein
MVTCPWCGTNYEKFQSNCSNCGGPISIPTNNTNEDGKVGIPQGSLQMPPPAPRSISDRYAWRLLVTDGWAVAALVFFLLGGIFTLVGLPLTLGIITAFVGIPFVVLGIPLFGTGIALAFWRYQQACKVVDVLRVGEVTKGQITHVEENLRVRINMSHPWVIHYQFFQEGQTYSGRVSTLNAPGRMLQPGQPAYILYLRQAPERNVLYPHP